MTRSRSSVTGLHRKRFYKQINLNNLSDSIDFLYSDVSVSNRRHVPNTYQCTAQIYSRLTTYIASGFFTKNIVIASEFLQIRVRDNHFVDIIYAVTTIIIREETSFTPINVNDNVNDLWAVAVAIKEHNYWHATAQGHSPGPQPRATAQGHSPGPQPRATAQGHSPGPQPRATAQGHSPGPQPRATAQGHSPGPQPRATAQGHSPGPQPRATAQGHSPGPQPRATAQGHSPGPQPRATAQGHSPGPQPRATAQGHSPGPQPRATAQGHSPGPQPRATAQGHSPGPQAQAQPQAGTATGTGWHSHSHRHSHSTGSNRSQPQVLEYIMTLRNLQNISLLTTDECALPLHNIKCHTFPKDYQLLIVFAFPIIIYHNIIFTKCASRQCRDVMFFAINIFVLLQNVSQTVKRYTVIKTRSK